MERRPGRAAGSFLGVLVAAVLGGLVGSYATRMMDTGGRPLASPGFSRSYTEVVEKGQPAARGEAVVQVVQSVAPAVVNIDTISRGREGGGGLPIISPGQEEVQEGQGSGFLINGSEGYVVTNNHVVENAQRIQVKLADKRTFPATVVGTDPVGDIALIRLTNAGKLPEVKFGDSDKLQIGQIVVAIGNPLGLENSVTQGVLSQIGRQLDGHIQGIPMDDLIQTDAAINPGNSGGPLLDAYGRVIGMNTAIIQRAQGIGFAVAANTIKRSVDDILKYGKVIRPWIGIGMDELTPQLAAPLGLPRQDLEGVVIASVRAGEPADRAGLQRADVVTEANGQRLAGVDDLRRMIRSLKPGEKLNLKGYRGKTAQAWQITVGKMPPLEELGR
jgi:serine protease Do